MSDPVEIYLKEATKYYIAKKYKEALISCNNAIQLDPKCARAYHGKGLIQTKQRKYKEASEDYEKSCALNSNNAKLHADMGELFYILDEFEKAGSHYRLAIQYDKKFELDYQQKTQELYYKASSLLHQWQREEAFSAYQQVLLFNPNNDPARSEISKIQKIMENLRKPHSQIHSADCKCPHCVNYT